MEEIILHWFSQAGIFSVIISILLNIAISVLGVIPSVFLTASNITFFGLSTGIFISYIGECAGAIISFLLYRKGIRYASRHINVQSKYLIKLTNAKGSDAFILVLSLRLFPFLPSGLINIGAAFSQIRTFHFALASSLGKIPALLIEGFSVYQVLSWKTESQLILLILSFFLLIAFKYFKKK